MDGSKSDVELGSQLKRRYSFGNLSALSAPLVGADSSPIRKSKTSNQLSSANSVATNEEEEESADEDLFLPEGFVNSDDIVYFPVIFASEKRNSDFHSQYRSVPDGDKLLEGTVVYPYTMYVYV